jgi:hypothetical protein
MPNSASLLQRRLTSIVYKKKRPGLRRVWPGGPGPGSTGFHRANSQAGFCLHQDRSQARVGRVSGRPAGPVQVLKLCFEYLKSHYIFWHYLDYSENWSYD